MRRLGFVSAIMIVLGACAAPDDEPAPALGRTSAAIVDGTSSPSAQDAAVLISDTGDPVCTGVLIAPNLVLTAHHCVADFDDRSECGSSIQDRPPNVLTISTGPSATPRGYVARGVRLFTPPNATQLCGQDVALLLLDNDIKDVTPAVVRLTDPALNELGTAVGYGDDVGSRAQRTGVKILALGPSTTNYTTLNGQSLAMNLSAAEVASTESTCFGDSGGPLLDSNGQVMAIASRGPDDRCKDRPTFWTTLSGHADLIEQSAIAAGHPLADAQPSTTPTGTNPTVAGTSTDTPAEAVDGGAAAKKTGTATPALSSGASCSAAPGPRGGLGPVWLAGVALALGRRRRGNRPGGRAARGPDRGATR